MGYPIHRASYRTLDPDWTGHVVIADIDRTYLATRFSSFKGMARIPFEGAAEKRDIAGMARLFRELRRGPGTRTRDTPLFFVSASPKQLRPVIERKMALDGIGFDGTTFKDWGRVFRRARMSRIREQVGFKLTALLTSRAALPQGAHELLLGDDLETDPLTYALYADLLAGRIGARDIVRILRLNGVFESDAKAIARMRRDLEPGRGVARAFIRLERHEHTDDFLEWGPGIVGCTGAFQIAAGMWTLGSVSVEGVGRVATELLGRGVERDTIRDRLFDLARRGLVNAEQAEQLGRRLVHHGWGTDVLDVPDVDPSWQHVQERNPERVWTPARFLGE